MFPKNHRLPLPVKKGSPLKMISSPCFLLKISENKTGHNRFGVVIANRIVKKSTKRHFWKRRIMGFLRTWPNLNKDFLIIVSPQIGEITPGALQQEFQKVLQKIT